MMPVRTLPLRLGNTTMNRPRMISAAPLAFGLSLVACVGAASVALAQAPGMIEFSVLGQTRQGLPMLKMAHEMVILGRDGWMHSLDPKLPSSQIRQTALPYEPISIIELRNELRSEFRTGFEVIATKSFLVVQPEGRGDRWPKMFEQSHQGFTRYMTMRGVNVREGRFPMVAVVLPDETAMYREFRKLGIDVKRVAGLYSGESNRVMTHDGGNSAQIAVTVRHEATHQSAYNSGVHSRLTETPKYISEGVGQMFEPEAMTSPRSSGRLEDRINRESLGFIKQTYHGRHNSRFTEAVMQLISDDSMFETTNRVAEAYHVSWAMMFYLAERDSAKFARLMNLTATRPPFRDYPRVERVNDFERIVGCDVLEFTNRLSWWLDSI